MDKRSVACSLYTDGGARGNPGPAAIGGVLYAADGAEIASYSRYLGETTNNQAEYRSLLHGLELARRYGCRRLRCYLDSELVVEQLRFTYKVKNADLAKVFVAVHNIAVTFDEIQFFHVPREKNKRADALVNRALDDRHHRAVARKE